MMSPEEKQVVEQFIFTNPQHSNRSLAFMLGKSPTTIAKMRKRLYPENAGVPEVSVQNKKPTEPLVSEDRLLEIAEQSARKFYRDDDPEFEDLVQEIVLGVLERQHEFDPSLGKAEQFVVSVARQKARNRITERRNERETVFKNHRARVPYPMRHREVGEADERGRLPFIDQALCMKRLEAILNPELLDLLGMLRKEWPESAIRKKRGWSQEEYQHFCDDLKAHAKSIF